MVQQITSVDEFQTAINGSGLVVIDFFATWCGPCKAIAPKVDQLSKTYTDATFYKVDVEELSEVAVTANVQAMPTFVFYKAGQKVADVVGANPAKLEATIKQNL
ncbi:cytosolic thioredoxin Trx1 [Schizosaccharomyces japonicus yFS275]|uniref:Thioredoxin n=1 Tax=Schizosaccharomyces japonicus (strain yFS275 / FY16936) TaxID=402676 RepID=B6K874_SCHJY|nr:cytosolic thioredoxin Trx1 [Schizosaccharomyces japonicus yFS275]EEB09728.1 cytosolic thioredoxin Trx1 [Schizosaccharomyces japonicus yFS275]